MKRRFVFTGVFVVCMALVCIGPHMGLAQAQTTDKALILLALNRARLASGLAPLAANPALEKAAQVHSNDMAVRGVIDHKGSDGSTPVERIGAAGYPAWQQKRIWAENVYAGSRGFDEALDYFLKDEAQSSNILSSQYRDVGIGVQNGVAANGTQLTYWTLSFGSQPNVLPIFINDGVTVITSPQVAIHLTQEEAVPRGEGNAVGSIIEIRLSNSASFKDATWQPWEALVPYTFDPLPGPKTLYVQMRDAGGRTTFSTASVQYDPNGTPHAAVASAGQSPTSSSRYEATRIVTPSPYRTPVPVHTVQPVAPPNRENSNGQNRLPTANVIIRTPATGVGLTEETDPQQVRQAQAPANPFDVILSGWLFPAYLFVQSGLLIAGAVWFLRLKRSYRQ